MLGVADLRRVARARRHGIVHPLWALLEARRAGVPYSLACALLMRESGGGRNVFGHDPTICVGWGAVTRAKYRLYLSERKRSGNRLMQGVGPLQLTWWSTQDAADREGGCWKWRPNVRVGLRSLAALIREHGHWAGIARYNGSGPAATAYANAVVAGEAWWRYALG
jgi:hypothetical protein